MWNKTLSQLDNYHSKTPIGKSMDPIDVAESFVESIDQVTATDFISIGKCDTDSAINELKQHVNALDIYPDYASLGEAVKVLISDE